MINFNNGKRLPNRFLGAEKKITVDMDGTVYMVKMPDPVRKKALKEDMSYKNNQFSEHIGCQIFAACGFKTQKTVLGTYTTDTGKEKLVVGCVVFDGLIEMKGLANETVDSDKKMRTTIEDVHYIIEHNPMIEDKAGIKNRFWDMFVIDALIGNCDRHLGNWGVVVTAKNDIEFAPIYDCGSSLGALVDEQNMKSNLQIPAKFSNAEKNVTSVYRFNEKRVFYHEIFNNPPLELEEALFRMFPLIKMDEIFSLIEKTEMMTDVHKTYMKQALELRYREILRPAFKRLKQKEADVNA